MRKIPIIVQRALRCEGIGDMMQQKYLVSRNMQVMDLLYYVRKSLLLPPYETLVLMLNNSLPSLNKTMNLLQHEEADKDGILYFYYTNEVAFG